MEKVPGAPRSLAPPEAYSGVQAPGRRPCRMGQAAPLSGEETKEQGWSTSKSTLPGASSSLEKPLHFAFPVTFVIATVTNLNRF